MLSLLLLAAGLAGVAAQGPPVYPSLPMANSPTYPGPPAYGLPPMYAPVYAPTYSPALPHVCNAISGYTVQPGADHAGDNIWCRPGPFDLMEAVIACYVDPNCFALVTATTATTSSVCLKRSDAVTQLLPPASPRQTCFYTREINAPPPPTPPPPPPFACQQVEGYTVIPDVDNGTPADDIGCFTQTWSENATVTAAICSARPGCVAFNIFGQPTDSRTFCLKRSGQITRTGIAAHERFCFYVKDTEPMLALPPFPPSPPPPPPFACMPVAGYFLVPDVYNPGGDVIIDGFCTWRPDWSQNAPEAAAVCDTNAECLAFGTFGRPNGDWGACLFKTSVHNQVRPRYWQHCWYIKVAPVPMTPPAGLEPGSQPPSTTLCPSLPGFTKTSDADHPGDDIQCDAVNGTSLPNATVSMCASNSSCVAIVTTANPAGDTMTVCTKNNSTITTLRPASERFCFYAKVVPAPPPPSPPAPPAHACAFLPGYTATLNADNFGDDITCVQRQGLNASTVAQLCSATPTCAGFSHWANNKPPSACLKTTVSKATPQDPVHRFCLYTKDAPPSPPA